jgi:hypothetical protein
VHGKADVTYVPGEWAETPEWLAEAGYYLLVFSSLKAARRFVQGLQYREIWTCRCEGKMNIPAHSLRLTGLSLGFLEPLPEIGMWPVCSRMFKRVKLLEKVT